VKRVKQRDKAKKKHIEINKSDPVGVTDKGKTTRHLTDGFLFGEIVESLLSQDFDK
jgi:hypothetical protein